MKNLCVVFRQRSFRRQHRAKLGPLQHVGKEVAKLTHATLLDHPGDARELPVPIQQRQFAVLKHVPADIADLRLILAARVNRLDIAIRFEQIKRRFEIMPHMLDQLVLPQETGDREQAGIGDTGGVNGAAFTVLAIQINIDALVEPVIDTLHVASMRPQMIDARERGA